MALIKYKVNGEWVNGGIATINSQAPDEDGNINIPVVPEAIELEDGTILEVVDGAWVPVTANFATQEYVDNAIGNAIGGEY